MKAKENICLWGIIVLLVGALAAAGAWENGAISFVGMLLLGGVCVLAAYQLVLRYRALQSARRHRAVRQAYRRVMQPQQARAQLRVVRTVRGQGPRVA